MKRDTRSPFDAGSLSVRRPRSRSAASRLRPRPPKPSFSVEITARGATRPGGHARWQRCQATCRLRQRSPSTTGLGGGAVAVTRPVRSLRARGAAGARRVERRNKLRAGLHAWKAAAPEHLVTSSSSGSLTRLRGSVACAAHRHQEHGHPYGSPTARMTRARTRHACLRNPRHRYGPVLTGPSLRTHRCRLLQLISPSPAWR